MDEQASRGKLSQALGVAFKVLLPFAAMRQSKVLIKREAQRTKDNIVVLKGLGKSAREAITGPSAEKRRDESFEEAIARRRPDAMSVEQLRRHFLSRKRVVLLVAAVSGVCAVMQILFGLWEHSPRSVLIGSLSIFGGQPMFFVVALGAQLRLWQIDTQRLSSSEHGGLGDYIRETPRWWLATLNPEFPFGKGEQA